MATKLWLTTIPVSERPNTKAWLDHTEGRHLAINTKMYQKPRNDLGENSTQKFGRLPPNVLYLIYHRIEFFCTKNRDQILSQDKENRKNKIDFSRLRLNVLKIVPLRHKTLHGNPSATNRIANNDSTILVRSRVKNRKFSTKNVLN